MTRRLSAGLGSIAALVALGLLAVWAYAPGLSGTFLFDDLVNLPQLGATGPVDDWPTFWRYVTSGTGDPTGRPIALLSFLVDANDWPADPAPFLRTNLLLHLCNGLLLFLLLRRLERRVGGRSQRTDMTALIGAGAWLLHPLLVSTTLYIVQREAILPATFTLLGLIAWAHGREQLQSAPRRGVAWMGLGIIPCTLLAVLSKANGVLLPLLAWVLDATVMRNPGESAQAARLARRLRRVLLVLPSLLLMGYLASYLPRVGATAPNRSWTIGQRLLTEPQVLIDYVLHLLVPRAASPGLFNDGFPVAKSLLQPATLFSSLLVAGLVYFAIACRRRHPVLAASLLFFFGAHLLESTVIPLEIYFEHRNYLPSLLLFWPLARAICNWNATLLKRATVAACVLLLLAATTQQRAMVWGQPSRMALLWAQQHPQSARAQASAATVEINGGQPRMAMRRIAPLLLQKPYELQFALSYANAACADHGLTPEERSMVARALRTAREGFNLAYAWLDSAIDRSVGADCPGMDLSAVADWVSAAQANPIMTAPGRQQDLAALQGRLALASKDPDAALRQFNRSLDAYPTPAAAAQQAALLASRGHVQHALAHLDYFQRLAPRVIRETGHGMPRLNQWIYDRQGYWPREIARLRAQLQSDLQAKSAR